MATELQESILKAFDVLYSNRIKDLKLDETVEVKVIQKIDDIKYKVEYNGGITVAYDSQRIGPFSVDDSVYMLVPQGDYSQKKILLATKPIDDKMNNSEYALDNYNFIGTNIIHMDKMLGSEITVDNITFDSQQFDNFLLNADAVYLSAKFKLKNKVEQLFGDEYYALTLVICEKVNVIEDGQEKIINGDTYYYTVSSKDVSGNPFSAITHTAYSINQAPKQNKVYKLEKIIFTSNLRDGNDCYVSEINLQGLSLLDEDGKYRVSIKTILGTHQSVNDEKDDDGNPIIYNYERGAFNSLSSEDKVLLNAKLKFNNVVPADVITYSWFIEDMSINESSEGYSPIAGYGWKFITSDEVSTANSKEGSFVSLNGEQCCLKTNIVRCIAQMNSNQTRYSQEYYLYNNAAKQNIKIKQAGINKYLLMINDLIIADLEDDDTFDGYTPKSKLKAVWIIDGVPQKETGFSIQRSSISIAELKCEVFVLDDNNKYKKIGQASYIPEDWSEGVSIIFENGDQVFIYDRNGLSPCSAHKGDDAIKTKTITANVYENNELSTGNYSFEWYCEENSLIKNIKTNGNSVSFEISDKFEIEKARVSQLTVVATYGGQTYTGTTNLTLIKDGEAGTNGTETAAVITCTSNKYSEYMPMIVVDINGNAKWNDGSPLSSPHFRCKLFKDNEEIPVSKVDWEIATLSSDVNNDINIDRTISSQNCILSWNKDGDKHYHILKSTVKDNGFTYYGYYPVPVFIEKKEESIEKYNFKIKKIGGIRNIVYKSNGTNPLFNSSNKITIDKDMGDFVYDYKIIGGKNENKDNNFIINNNGQITSLPSYYSGRYANYNIEINIIEKFSGKLCGTLYYPLCMILDRYGYENINGWDGHKLEISEDENYILTPQLIAGEKKSDNSFTGLVLGTNEADGETALFGYANGEQSAKISATTGEIVLGVASSVDEIGQIKLVPGGASKIGAWNIGANALYNTTNEQATFTNENEGIILSADPPFVEAQGKDEDNRFSVRIDPLQNSVFTINQYDKDGQKKAIAGINKNGEFYSSALEKDEIKSSLDEDRKGMTLSVKGNEFISFTNSDDNKAKILSSKEIVIGDENKNLAIKEGSGTFSEIVSAKDFFFLS